MRLSPLFVGAALAAARALAAEDCPAPALKIESSAPAPRQGGIAVLTLWSSAPLSRAVLADGKHQAAMEPEPASGGLVLRALWGIDFEAAVGAKSVGLEAFGHCGDDHPDSWKFRVASGNFPQQKLSVNPAYVEPPESEKERIAHDREKVAAVWAAPPTPRVWDRAFVLPVEATPGGNFGARRVFNGKTQSRHAGADLVAAAGTPIKAPAAGTVRLAEDLYFSGGTVIVDHGGDLFTTYFHMSRIDVKPGDRVRTGDVLGAVGATGRATGPHLHWGARLNGARVNPLGLLKLPAWSTPAESGTLQLPDRSVRYAALSFSK
ncbi:MAG TPA: M23 family metallopeptidase [Thermoanaerobaculia bacterium]